MIVTTRYLSRPDATESIVKWLALLMTSSVTLIGASIGSTSYKHMAMDIVNVWTVFTDVELGSFLCNRGIDPSAEK
jgi:hypothetical protein